MNRFFKHGDKGIQIEVIQQRLQQAGFYKHKVDGIFGKDTEASVINFQLKAALNADGVVGPKTWLALGLSPHGKPDSLTTPNGLDEIINIFGDPLEPGYWSEYGGFCVTPPELNHVFQDQFENKNGFWCNKLLIPTFQRVYTNIVRSGLSNELKTFDGCYNVRYIRGRMNLSTHSWGISVDHNAATNLLGAKPTMHKGIVSVFKDMGFMWGGSWNRKDGMHFQFATGY